MIKKMLHGVRIWIPIGFVTTVLAGTIFVAVQQSTRQAAYEPQIQVAEDASDLKLVSNTKVDISKSLNTFTIIFDGSGKVLATNAMLDGQTPQLPAGVLDYTKVHGEDRITWEPKEGVRIATVIEYFGGANSGFVLAGRNMREVEKRIILLGEQVLFGWTVAMVGGLFIIGFLEVLSSGKK